MYFLIFVKEFWLVQYLIKLGISGQRRIYDEFKFVFRFLIASLDRSVRWKKHLKCHVACLIDGERKSLLFLCPKLNIILKIFF